MCDEEKRERDCGCIHDILKKILLLQKQDFEEDTCTGCDKPFLGPICNNVCYNTRPIKLYNCCTGEPWRFSFTDDGKECTSDVFRIEALDDCCCTCRILRFDECTNQFVGTSEFFTLDLNCVGAIKCLADTFIELC